MSPILIVREGRQFRNVNTSDIGDVLKMGDPLDPSDLINFGAVRCNIWIHGEKERGKFYEEALNIGKELHADYVLVPEHVKGYRPSGASMDNISQPITLYLKKQSFFQRLFR